MPASGSHRSLGEKTYSQQEQLLFAEASGDFNPMHMDPIAARRLLSGQQVVHGVHTLLSALERWHNDSGVSLQRVRCGFVSPVSVGDTVVFIQTESGPDETTLVASVDGLTCTEVAINAAVTTAGDVEGLHVDAVRQMGDLRVPLDEAVDARVGRVLRVDHDYNEALARCFPNAAAAIGPHRVSAIAALSYFVGMVCPGLHSMFSSVAFMPDDLAQDVRRLTFVIRKYDKRSRLVIVEFAGTIRGELRAFVRPPPQPQPSMQDIAARIEPSEFRGTTSLVLGGSRGLGETVAKILAAGGADVIISHATGVADAQRVATEINAAGPGRCSTIELDLTADSFARLAIDVASLGTVYYFPTPRIYRRKARHFDPLLFREFAAFYIERFEELCTWLDGSAHGRRINVFLPSTVFIGDRPRGMTEYAMAKAAAEVLATDLNRSLQDVRVVCTRLPRMSTDQTASILAVGAEPVLDVMLPVVRAMQT
jgi:acyl dehydratase/NAD(P)-dependent dehydrogenase (short-subunit alcohol dehydrogenase family)